MNKRSLSTGRDLMFQTQVRHNLKRNNIKPTTGRALLFKTQIRYNLITSNAITSNLQSSSLVTQSVAFFFQQRVALHQSFLG